MITIAGITTRIKVEHEDDYEHEHGLEADLQAAREQEEARRLARQAAAMENRL
jgi:hypothetical protein